MKKRIIALLLGLIILASFVSCTKRVKDYKRPSFNLQVTYTEQDMVELDNLITQFNLEFNGGQNSQKLNGYYQQIKDKYQYLLDQETIAYTYYYSDLNNNDFFNTYSDISDSVLDANTKTSALEKMVYDSDCAYKTEFFANWSDRDYLFLSGNKEVINPLEKQKDDIIEEYMDLIDDYENNVSRINQLYCNFVEKSNLIAKEYGYNNFYEFATPNIYLRDYTSTQRDAFRSYVKEYMVPLYFLVSQERTNLRKEYGRKIRNAVSDFIYESYDSINADFLKKYIASFSGSVNTKFNSMFTDNTTLFATKSSSYDGAYTCQFYTIDSPGAYFGTIYQDYLTVVHEMGHYAAYYYWEDDLLSYDLAEIHSQANEWMFLAYLQNYMHEKVYKLATIERLLSGIYIVIVGTFVDNVEEIIYTATEPISYTQYDAVIQNLIKQYGLQNYPGDLAEYFKNVCFTSPVYYISYSTSELLSILFYGLAQQDYGSAQEIYKFLLEEVNVNLPFTQAVAQANLDNPFIQETFIKVDNIVDQIIYGSLNA